MKRLLLLFILSQTIPALGVHPVEQFCENVINAGELLGVAPEAGAHEIGKKYKRAAFKSHPDKNLDKQKDAHKLTQELTDARDLLLNKDQEAQNLGFASYYECKNVVNEKKSEFELWSKRVNLLAVAATVLIIGWPFMAVGVRELKNYILKKLQEKKRKSPINNSVANKPARTTGAAL